MSSSNAEQMQRAPPGGVQTVILGDDSAAWSTTSDAHCKFAEGTVTQVSHEPRKPPGGTDSVQLGGPISSPAAEELLARPSPGGADSIAFGANANGLPAAELLVRASPGGDDSVKKTLAFVADGVSTAELLSRPWPGGSATVVLGGDTPGWSTDSQAVGVGTAEAAAMMESTVRQAPGGVDSVSFNAEQTNMGAEELLARPSPGGADSVDFALWSAEKSKLSSETLLARPRVGGSTTVVLGGDSSEWTTNSTVVGVGSVEAIAVSETPVRHIQGGKASIEFGAAEGNLPSAELLARPSPGGETAITLGGDKVDWKTNSSAFGVGSVEAIAEAEPRSRPPPGGMDSVDSITCVGATASAEELLARRPTGGKATVVLGGDDGDWATSSGAHGTVTLSNEVIERQGPGGVDSVVLGAGEESSLTAEELFARPSPGGADSVDFTTAQGSSVAAADLLVRPSPGGIDKIILGSDNGAWATSSQTHNGTPGVMMEPGQSMRPPPGGVDSVSMVTAQEDTVSVETLLARPAPGGAATVVLGGYAANWATCSSTMGSGCADAAVTAAPAATAHTAAAAADSIDFASSVEQTPAKPMRTMNPNSIACSPTVSLNDEGYCPEPGVSSNRFACGSNQNAGNVITDRSSTRLHQAPGGNSSINLSDGTVTETPTRASSNQFATGSNQNQGNWITDRSTTRLHHAPGGQSTINLGDDSASPEVGVSSNRFARGSNPNQGNEITDRASTKVRHAPGGKSSLCLGDPKAAEPRTQDENVNVANIQQTPQGVEKLQHKAVLLSARQAPGGDASVILG